MIGRLLDFVVGREPVASATGIAGVVTAVLGLVAALGADIDPEVVAAVGALAAAVAGWLARKAVTPVAGRAESAPTNEGGWAPILSLIVAAVAIALAFVACDVLFDDDDDPDDLGAPAWMYDNRDDNRNGDCRHAGDNCSDDDHMSVLVCVQPDSCRFG